MGNERSKEELPVDVVPDAEIIVIDIAVYLVMRVTQLDMGWSSRLRLAVSMKAGWEGSPWLTCGMGSATPGKGCTSFWWHSLPVDIVFEGVRGETSLIV